MPDSESRAHEPVALSLEPTLRLWQRSGLSWRELIRRTRRAYAENHFDARSAQFAYYSLLALFPLLILILAVVAQLPVRGVIENSLEAADRGLPVAVASLLKSQVAEIQRHTSLSLIGISVFILLGAGSKVFLTLSGGLNRAYNVQETRPFWKRHGLALILTVATSLLMVVALVLMVIGPLLSSVIAARHLDVGWLEVLVRRGVRWLGVGAILWIYTSTVYCLGPNAKLPWYWLSPGSVLATLGWIVVSQGFRLYVENLGKFNETYGALCGVIVLVIWLNLSGGMLLLGGQLNAVIHAAAVERARGAPAPPAAKTG
jgi:membrane protein